MSTATTMIELPLPPGVERRTIDTSRGIVTALRARPGATQHKIGTAIMASGFFGTKEDFREVLPMLASRGYDTWAYDYPGQLGEHSGSTGDEYTIPAMAAHLREIVATVSEDQPVHVVGHCLGGFVAREAVLAEPASARTLTLLACGPSMREPKHRAMINGLAVLHKNGGTMALWPLVKRLLAEDDAIMREFWHAKLATMNPYFVTQAAMSMGEENDRSAELPARGIRSLVVHGKRDKRLWSAGVYADMARALDADLVVIEKASHSPNMEQPEPTANALLKFWATA
jgi:pimeloyl-ACP methyl ester carboxylesterase